MKFSIRTFATIATGIVVSSVLAACGSSGTGSTDSTRSAPTTSVIARDRCQQNRAAGTMTFVTSYDFSASANILGPIVAKAEGYFDDVCLDVKIQPGFAPGNAGLVASGRAQMGSGGSMGELMNNNLRGGGDLVAVVDYGKTAIEELVVPANSGITRVQDLRGATIGVKGDIPYSIQTMLDLNGVPRSSLKEVLLEGFDPVAQLELGLDALPVYKSNEPRQLDAAGIKYRTLDPLDFKIPSSFGIQFTSRSFLQAHRSAVQDFVRASFKGFQFGLEHPRAAVNHAIDLVKAADGTLTLDGELYRWKTESAIVLRSTPKGEPYGLIDVGRVQAEAEAETRVGVFKKVPDFATMIDGSLARSVWQGTTLRWPS